MIRVAAFYAASTVVLALFGCEVCPFIHALGRYAFATVLGGFFLAAYLLRWPLQRVLVLRRPALERPWRQFQLDFGLFLGVGVAMTIFDTVAYGFPVFSGVRATVGCVAVGFFAGIDGALMRERDVLSELSRPGAGEVRAKYSLSLSRKFVVVALATLTLVGAVLYLLSVQDLKVQSASVYTPVVGRELAFETAFAVIVMYLLTANVIVGFARNLRTFLQNQNRVLDEVAQGRFDVRVPVASNDEFGLIAEHTNRMIDGLRERERIRDAFGKLVSPSIANRLLGADGVRLGGERRSLVVLFSDVRNFTGRTERSDPETIVAELNAYFTRMVHVVHAHGGVVDKFIGDGLMAVFGLENPASAADDAVRAAAAMQRELQVLNPQLSQPIAVGIGIHAGDVVAGTIGSPERLEYTFIGDTVNSAARIEGLTKELDSAVLVSEAVFRALSPELAAWPWRDLGPQKLRGKAEGFALWGLRVEQAVEVAVPGHAPLAGRAAVAGTA